MELKHPEHDELSEACLQINFVLTKPSPAFRLSPIHANGHHFLCASTLWVFLSVYGRIMSAAVVKNHHYTRRLKQLNGREVVSKNPCALDP